MSLIPRQLFLKFGSHSWEIFWYFYHVNHPLFLQKFFYISQNIKLLRSVLWLIRFSSPCYGWHPMWILLHVVAAPLLDQDPCLCSGKAAEVAQETVPLHLCGDLEWAPDSWLQIWQLQPFAACGWKISLSVALFFLQIFLSNKKKTKHFVEGY